MAYVIKRENRFTGYYRHAGKRLSAGTWDTETEAMYNAIQAERSGLRKPSKAKNTNPIAKSTTKTTNTKNLPTGFLKRNYLDTLTPTP